MVIKYTLHGSFSIFLWKRKGKDVKNFQGCSTSDCAHLLQVSSSMCSCVCGQVFSDGVQLFYTRISAHLVARLSLEGVGLHTAEIRKDQGLSDIKDNREVAQDWQISPHKSGTIKWNHTLCFQLNQKDEVSMVRLDYIKHAFCTYNHIATQSKKNE